MELEPHYTDAIQLLMDLIQTPSLSEQEEQAADLIQVFFEKRSIPCQRFLNNIWAVNQHFSDHKPTLLLNSHIDTVPPNKGYTRDPYKAEKVGDQIYGLGSNDAGGCLVTLMAAFIANYKTRNLPYNLVFAATAEEENSGPNGLKALLPILPNLDFAIIGEPTGMNIAIAERGLMVVEATTKGAPGHAAHYQGVSALDHAIDDLLVIRSFEFSETSAVMGPTRISVNVIHAGEKHNVVASRSQYLIDIRLTDALAPEEVLTQLQKHLQAHLKIRSLRPCPPVVSESHPLVRAGLQAGGSTYVSPTSSDRALLTIPAIKMAPGDTRRSHSADEFVLASEIEAGIRGYLKVLKAFRP